MSLVPSPFDQFMEAHAQLKLEVQALRRDAARLDWLAEMLQDVQIGNCDPTMHFTDELVSDPLNAWPQVWRRAIDAVLRGGK